MKRKRVASPLNNAVKPIEGWLQLAYWGTEHYMVGGMSLCGQRFYRYAAMAGLTRFPQSEYHCKLCERRLIKRETEKLYYKKDEW